MLLEWYQHLPLNISPIAFKIGSFSVRWYAVSYLAGFIVAYIFLLWRIRNEDVIEIAKIKEIKYKIIDFLLVVFFSALIGGRIGYVLFYNFSYFISHPLAIISPFENGSTVGIYGMSYHGALAAIIAASFIFIRIKKINFFLWADFVVPAAAIGYFFGRIGNFLNGELYGKITTSPLGMYFLSDMEHLRYPSQLFEAFLEGIILFIILWRMRRFDLPEGFLFASYLIGYACFRIMGEFFRQPDVQIGYIFNLLTMGQLLSAAMLVFGVALIIKIKKCK